MTAVDVHNSETLQESEEAYKAHMTRKEMSHEEKERDKKRAENDKTFAAIIGDLEQVSPCPKATAQDFFFVSKLSCYNYSVYNLGTKDGTCYRWDESKSDRGANEIGSCVRHYLTKALANDVTEVVIWADTCGGQKCFLGYSYPINSENQIKTKYTQCQSYPMNWHLATGH